MTGPTRDQPDAGAWPDETVDPRSSTRWGVAVIVSVCVVFGAIAAEVVAGMNANSESSPWAKAFPLSWTPPVRVAWWLFVAAAAGTFRLGLHRLGFRQRPLLVAASVIPFVGFAFGIATGSSWTTWH